MRLFRTNLFFNSRKNPIQNLINVSLYRTRRFLTITSNLQKNIGMRMYFSTLLVKQNKCKKDDLKIKGNRHGNNENEQKEVNVLKTIIITAIKLLGVNTLGVTIGSGILIGACSMPIVPVFLCLSVSTFGSYFGSLCNVIFVNSSNYSEKRKLIHSYVTHGLIGVGVSPLFFVMYKHDPFLNLVIANSISLSITLLHRFQQDIVFKDYEISFAISVLMTCECLYFFDKEIFFHLLELFGGAAIFSLLVVRDIHYIQHCVRDNKRISMHSTNLSLSVIKVLLHLIQISIILSILENFLGEDNR
jgi:hypothetical protein